MTKRELVIQVAAKLGYTQNEVGTVVQAMLDQIVDSLARGDRLEIRNFGVFEVRTRDARVGRNPRTGEEVAIVSKRVATFKAGKSLKEWVRSGGVTPSADAADPEPNPPAEQIYSEDPAQAATPTQAATISAESETDESPSPGEQQPLF